MRQTISPAIAVGVIVLIVLVIGIVFWVSDRGASKPRNLPVQAMGREMPKQPVVPKAPGP